MATAPLEVLEQIAEIHERMAFVMPDDHSREERGRLLRIICERMRILRPGLPLADFYAVKTRLQKTPVSVLRQIAELDLEQIAAEAGQ